MSGIFEILRNSRDSRRRGATFAVMVTPIVATGAFGVAATTSSPAAAAGYYAGPTGAAALGRGGAFVAKADDLTAAIYNPAGLARDVGGERVGPRMPQLRLQLENKATYSTLTFQRSPTRDGRGASAPLVTFEPVQNGQPWRLLGPFFGVASNLGLPGWNFALVSFTPSGAARSQFPIDGPQKYLLVEKEVVVINTSLNAAWRPRREFALGLSLQAISVPSLRYQLVLDNTPGSSFDVYNPVESTLDTLATIRGSDPFTLNINVGLWAQPHSNFELGVSAQVLPSSIDAAANLAIEPISPVAVELLQNQDPPIDPRTAIELTRDGNPANDVRISLPLPLTVRAGARFIERRADRSELFDVELNATYETWSRVDTFTMRGNGLQARLLGLDNNPIPLERLEVAKGWQDALTLALGSDIHPVDAQSVLRVGSYFETAVTPQERAHVDFPGGAHWGLTAGLGWLVGAFRIQVAYEHRRMLTMQTSEADGQVLQLKPNLGTDPPAGALPPVVNAGRYSFSSHNVALGVSWAP